MRRATVPALLSSVLFLLAATVQAQNVGINGNGAAPDASAILDLDVSSAVFATKKGLLIPRIALTAANVAAPVTAPATSLLIYNTATAGVAPNNVTPGFHYWDGAAWVRIASGAAGWTILGNAGTNPTTNFIGTTDANDWVIKTGGSAAANERARVKSTGQVTVNNTGFFTGDVFSVYANNTTNGTTNSINNTAGTFAVNGYASGNGTGVYGETAGGASTAGTAIWGDIYGTATTASNATAGVLGTNSTAPAGTGATAAVASGVEGNALGAAGTAFTMGVLGINTGVAGSAFGVYGQTSSPGAMGVFGVNLDVSVNPGHGIQGQAAGIGGAAGVRGFNTAAAVGAGQSAYGVRGSVAVAPTGTGFTMGVRGDVTGASGSTYGVYGQSASSTGFGIDGFNSNAAGTGAFGVGNNVVGLYLTNGSGGAFTGNTTGGFGFARAAANGVGLIGVGNNLTGSIIAPATGSGVVGVGAQYGVMGYATTTVNTNPAANATTNGAAASAGGYFEVQAAGVPQTWAYVGVRDNTAVNRKIIGPGTVNTVVQDGQGRAVALSCPEAPENLFQDYGAGVLVNGRAHVELDPIFSRNIAVDQEHPLRAFVQLEGDCAGVYVTNKTARGFDVVELNGGTSNVPFAWTVTANRADEANPDGTVARYSDERFPLAPTPQRTTTIEAKDAPAPSMRNERPETIVPELPVPAGTRAKGRH